MKTDLTITVAGAEYPVNINDDDGTFRVHLGELGELKDGSFAGLKAKARKVKVPFSLPFTFVHTDGIRHGAVTGIHAGNGNLLVRWDDGKTEQLARWSGGAYIPRLDAAGDAELQQLILARNQAQRAVEEFVKPRVWDSLNKAAARARDEAAQAVQDQETGDPS